MKKNLLTCLLWAGMAGAAFVSCDKGENETTYSTSGYFTITGDVSSGYTLYRDYGGVVKPNMADVVSKLGSEGFGTDKRAAMTFLFKDEDVKDYADGQMVENATLGSGETFQVRIPMTTSEAAAQGITESDSLFSISLLSNVWCYRGYLTTIIYGPVSQKSVDGESKYVYPTFNMVYDPTAIAENKLDLTICYNRHSSQESSTAATVDFYTSYDITSLLPLIPGSDSIEVTLRVKGADVASSKIGRQDFRMENYEPYK